MLCIPSLSFPVVSVQYRRHNDQVIRTMMHDEVDILLSVGKLSQNMI